MELHGLPLLLLIIFASVQVGEAQVKSFLLNCGSNSSITIDGRTWAGDVLPVNNVTISNHGVPASASASAEEQPKPVALYTTARIFNTTSSYNFSITPGLYSVRLHFSSSSFGNFNSNESWFDVVANNVRLVSRFNVPEEVVWKKEVSDWNSSYLVKEYFVNVNRNLLSIQLVPQDESFAYVNAIEVMPVMDELFVDSARNVDSGEVNSSFHLADRAIETMYRLNVGGPAIKSSRDSDLWRSWDSDENFMFSVNAANVITNSSNISYASAKDSAAAPLLVYETAKATTNNQVVERRFNMSWRFGVDPNFDYLIRLHFCELTYDKPNQRVFKIYINNKTAAENYDVFVQGKGRNKAYHEDFLDTVPQQVDTLWLQLGPDSVASTSDTDALLNGLEIFKLSRNGNLAHFLRRVDVGEGGAGAGKSKGRIVLVAIAGAVAIVAIVLVIISGIVCFYIRKRRGTDTKEDTPGWRPLFLHSITGTTTNARTSKAYQANGSMATNRMGRVFTLSVIRSATNNFDESLIIGTGGFGKVFKGEIEGILVAIKRANPQSQQGLKEFETEIEILSKLRHRHLVSMIGYCDEQNEMILVYEYMANGTLRSHLFGSDLPPLTWRQRLEACIGAAKGLHYLHTGADRGIIHRDVKTTNILLDEAFIAKMADFGLSKDGPALDQTHVSTAVKGSFGYLDPEYFRRQQLTQKSDVYSFGVVLLEVVCARPVIDPTLPRDQVNLAEWALRWQRQQSLETIVDPKLEGAYPPESLKKIGEIAEKCLADEGKDRPAMGDVLWHLESLLQSLLQEATQNGGAESFTTSKIECASCISLHQIKEGEEEEEEDVLVAGETDANSASASGH